MMRSMDTSVNAFSLATQVKEDSDAVTVEQIVDSHGKVLNEVVRLNHLVWHLIDKRIIYLYAAVLVCGQQEQATEMSSFKIILL